MVGFLASYWYYRKRDLAEVPGPLILDSGAFSAFTQGGAVDVDEFAEWIDRVADANSNLRWAVNLDVIGDGARGTAASLENWRYLTARARTRSLSTGRPEPEIVPVVHFTSPVPFEEQIKPYLDEGARRVCFGGGVGAAPKASTQWAAYGLAWLRDNSPETLTHGLGVGPWVARARLPWDSTDCSDFGLGYRFGYVRMPHPERRAPVDIKLGTGTPPSRQAAQVIRRYGVDPRDCTSPVPATRCAAIARLSFRGSEHEEERENARRRRAAAAADSARSLPTAPSPASSSPTSSTPMTSSSRSSSGISETAPTASNELPEKSSYRPVTRYVVDGNVYAEPQIFAEMGRAATSGPYRPRPVLGKV